MPAPTRVSTGGTVFATDINQYADRLNRQSGQSETGLYFLSGPAYTTGAVVALWVLSLSRDATPSGVVIDTATLAPTGGLGTLSTAQLSTSGFQIFTLGSTGPNTNCRAGGNFTISF